MKRIIKYSLIITSILTLIFIVVITSKLINKTNNPAFLDIDFENKYNTIGSYATLIGAILSFLTIVFLIFQITQQNEQYNNDKKNEKLSIKNSQLNKLKLIHNLLNEVLKHINSTSEEMGKYLKSEKEYPLASNYMSIFTNKNYYRLLELDYPSVYNAFMEYSKETDITHNFNMLYKLVDFYSESFIEIKSKTDYNINKKFKTKLSISEDINKLRINISSIIEEYKIAKNSDNKWHLLFTKFIKEFDTINVSGKELDFEVVLTLFEKLVANIETTYQELQGFDKHIESLANEVVSIKNKIQILKFDSVNFESNLELRLKKYYLKESEFLIELNNIIRFVKTMIDNNSNIQIPFQ